MTYKILARRGASAGMPTLDNGELGQIIDTKQGLLGDGTASGQKIATTKTTVAMDFSSMPSIKYNKVITLAGAVATPSFVITSGADVNTGFYAPALAQIGVAVAGLQTVLFTELQTEVKNRLVLSGTEGVKIPTGPTSGRGAATLGKLRINTSLGSGVMEFCDSNGSWIVVATTSTTGINNYAVTTGSSSAFVAVLDNGATALTPGMEARVKMHSTNGNGSTLRVNTLPAKTMFRNTGEPVSLGDCVQNSICVFYYDNVIDGWRLGNSSTAGGDGSGGTGDANSLDYAVVQYEAAEDLELGDVLTMSITGQVSYALPDSHPSSRLRPVLLGGDRTNVTSDTSAVVGGAVITDTTNYGSRSTATTTLLNNDRFVTVGLNAARNIVITFTDLEGLKIGSPIVVSATSYPTSASSNKPRRAPAVYSFANGNFAVVWDNNAVLPAGTIQCAVFSNTGAVVQAQFTALTVSYANISRGMSWDACVLPTDNLVIASATPVPSNPWALQTTVITNNGVVVFADTTHTRPAHVDDVLLGFASIGDVGGASNNATFPVQVTPSGTAGDFIVAAISGPSTPVISVGSTQGRLQAHTILANNVYGSRIFLDTTTYYGSWNITTGPNGNWVAFRRTSTYDGSMTGSGVTNTASIFAGTTNTLVGTQTYIDGGSVTNGTIYMRGYVLSDNSIIILNNQPITSTNVTIAVFTGDATLSASLTRSGYTYTELNYSLINSERRHFGSQLVELADGTAVVAYCTCSSDPTKNLDKLLRIDLNTKALLTNKFYPILTTVAPNLGDYYISAANNPEYNAVTNDGVYIQIFATDDVQDTSNGTNCTINAFSIATTVKARAPVGVAMSTGIANNELSAKLIGKQATRLRFAPSVSLDARGVLDKLPGQRMLLSGNLAILYGMGPSDVTYALPIHVPLYSGRSYTIPAGRVFRGRLIGSNGSGGTGYSINGESAAVYTATTGSATVPLELNAGDIIASSTVPGLLALNGILSTQ